jgi:ribulose-phosphate 3-epimerase
MRHPARPLPSAPMPAELMDDLRVAPSILSADFARLGEQVAGVMDAGARVIHVDVMDGHFVPPITIGPLIVQSLAGQVHDAGGVLDVHLMIERPERHVQAFAGAGADAITVHFEATPHVNYALRAVREAGCRAGLALNPGTPATAATELGEELDHLLCMTVNPGWGGQSFIEGSIAKVERLRQLLPVGTPIEVDGGVDPATAPRCVEAGATLLVAGSNVFGAPDAADRYRRLAESVGAT